MIFALKIGIGPPTPMENIKTSDPTPKNNNIFSIQVLINSQLDVTQLKSEKSFQDYWYVTPYILLRDTIYPPARSTHKLLRHFQMS